MYIFDIFYTYKICFNIYNHLSFCVFISITIIFNIYSFHRYLCLIITTVNFFIIWPSKEVMCSSVYFFTLNMDSMSFISLNLFWLFQGD